MWVKRKMVRRSTHSESLLELDARGSGPPPRHACHSVPWHASTNLGTTYLACHAVANHKVPDLILPWHSVPYLPFQTMPGLTGSWANAPGLTWPAAAYQAMSHDTGMHQSTPCLPFLARPCLNTPVRYTPYRAFHAMPMPEATIPYPDSTCLPCYAAAFPISTHPTLPG